MDQTTTTSFEKFDGYEIAQVVEYVDDQFGTVCEPLAPGGSIEERRAAADYHADFWTLYGHIPSEGVLAIGDFKTEADAMEILARIGGTRTP